jgi:hypothetical protein
LGLRGDKIFREAISIYQGIIICIPHKHCYGDEIKGEGWVRHVALIRDE